MLGRSSSEVLLYFGQECFLCVLQHNQEKKTVSNSNRVSCAIDITRLLYQSLIT